MNPEDLLEMTKEQLIEKLQEINLENEQVMASLVMIREELLTRLKEEKKDGEIIGEYSVKKAIRVSFNTEIEKARELGAVKEAVDTSILRKLDKQGVEVPGKKETEYLSVRRLSQDE